MIFYRTNILVLIFERSSWKNTTSSSSYPNKLIQIRKGKRILLKMRFTIELTVHTDVVPPRVEYTSGISKRVTADHSKLAPRYHGGPTFDDRFLKRWKKFWKRSRTRGDSKERGNVHADVERTTTAVPLAIYRTKEIRTAGSQVPTTRYLSLYLTVHAWFAKKNAEFLPAVIDHRSSMIYHVDFYFLLYYLD